MTNMDYKISFMIYSPYGQDYDNNYDSNLEVFIYNETMISLGSQTRETLDKSLDSASLQICLSNRPVEFQPYTVCSLLFYNEDATGKPKDGKYHFLVIESDRVEEQFIGDTIKYNHNIILVEATKLLETELMPNITFTQPVKNITLGTSWGQYTTNPQQFTHAKGSVNAISATDLVLDIGVILMDLAGGSYNLTETNSMGANQLINLISKWTTGKEVYEHATLHDEWRTALKSMKIKANIPDQNIPAELLPGFKFPMITQTIDIKGFLSVTETIFGNNGVFGAITSSIANPVSLLFNLIKLIAWIFGDVTPRIILYPNSVLLLNKTDKKVWELTDTVTNKETLSKEKYFAQNVAKWTSEECSIDQELITPDDITPGEYTVLYSYNLKKMWMRNFQFPINAPYEDSQIDKPIPELDNKTVADIANASMMMAIDGLTATNTSIAIGLGDIDAYYSTDYIYMDEFLRRIENQINCKKEVQRSKIYAKANCDYEAINIRERKIWSKVYKLPETYRDLSTIDVKVELKRNTPQEDDINFERTFSGYCDVIAHYYNDNDVEVGSEKQTFNLLLRNKSWVEKKFRFNTVNSATKYKIEIYIHTNTIPSPNVEDFGLNVFMIYVNKYVEPKYKFSNSWLSLARTIKCPEFTFEKKTLWEVCNEIGEVFHGIPRLREGNIIDFDIVNDNKRKTLAFNRETQEAEYNMANYATRLFTPELKNIILDNIDDTQLSYIYYPYENGWTKVRAKEYFETGINRTTSVVHIENGDDMSSIYKIKQLWCRTKFDGDEDFREFNITNYIVEKNIWDGLSSNIMTIGDSTDTSEKGLYLYYIKGDSNIYNVAQLPDNKSVIGWKQRYLTIQYILARQFSIPVQDTSKNIFDYEFRVVYAPYNSRMNITRNSNLSDIYIQISTNFNQPSKNISAKAFSSVSQNLLERMCKPTVKTSYTSMLIDDGLNIGDCINLKGHNYYINNKITTYNNNSKEVALELSRDNYKQDERVAVSREYRPYNIDSDNQVRKTLSQPFSVIVGEGEYTELAPDTKYVKDYSSANKQVIAKSIRETLTRGVYSKLAKLTLAYVEPLDVEGNLIKYNTFRSDVSPSKVQPKLLPVVSDVLGNTMTFQWNMFDNYSAGRKIVRPGSGAISWWDNFEFTVPGTDITLKEKDYGLKIQTDARYCDDIGATPKIYTSFFGINPKMDLNSGYETVYSHSDKTLGGNLPDCNGITREGISKVYAQNELTSSAIVNKDSREKLSYQMTVSVQTFDPDIEIYELLKYNPLVSDRAQASPVWYGYTNDNIPDDSGVYDISNGLNEGYKLDVRTRGGFEIEGDVAVNQTISNNTGTSFVGFVLVSSNNEIFLNVRKTLNNGDERTINYTVFNDEMTMKDIKHETPTVQVSAKTARAESTLKDYQPVISYINGDYFLDLEDLFENTGLTYEDVKISLVTKHNTYPRGMVPHHKSRNFAKYRKGTSLYKVSNVYLDNPVTRVINGREKVYTPFLFSKIKIDDNGELYYNEYRSNTRYNISHYLQNKKISNQNFGGKHYPELINLDYGFVLSKDGQNSEYTTNFRYTFDNGTRLPTNVSVL